MFPALLSYAHYTPNFWAYLIINKLYLVCLKLSKMQSPLDNLSKRKEPPRRMAPTVENMRTEPARPHGCGFL